MCLGIPMKLVEINGDVGIGEVTGVQRIVHLNMIENPQVGNFVLVHAGFAIETVNEQEAEETIRLLQEIKISVT